MPQQAIQSSNAPPPPPGYTLDAPGSSVPPLPAGYTLDSQETPAPPDKPGFLDKEIPLDSYKNATLSGVQSIGRGFRSLGQGVKDTLDPSAHPGEEGVFSSVPGVPDFLARSVYRVGQGLVGTAKGAAQVPAAIKDINASPDPTGTYAKAAQATAGEGAAQALTALGTEGVMRGVPWLKNKIPNTARAGQNFQDVMGAAKSVPIDTTAAGNTALQIKDFTGRGGRLPKVVNDFIRRATDPNLGPITYEESRDFASNAGALSVEERNALKPQVRRMVGKFARDLNDANEAAATQAGKGAEYTGAMTEYRQAKTIQDFQNMLRGAAVNSVKYGVPTAVGGTVAGYVAKKALGGK